MLDEVRCTGNELAIEQCPKSAWGEHNCEHKEDAGVSCTPLTGKRATRPPARRPRPRLCGAPLPGPAAPAPALWGSPPLSQLDDMTKGAHK